MAGEKEKTNREKNCIMKDGAEKADNEVINPDKEESDIKTDKVIKNQENERNDEKDAHKDKDQKTEQIKELSDQLETVKKQLEKKESELKGYIDIAQRMKAEFDNYKRRVAKEKDDLYTDITGDIASKILPVVDNMERAVSSDSKDVDSIKEGLNMILKQLIDILKKEGIEETEALGKEFDPNLHNAVMHVEDDSVSKNIVVEVFQKGYLINGKVLRHSMVKVAN